MGLEPWYPKPLCTSPAPYQHEAMMADIILSPIYLPHIYYMLLTDPLKTKTETFYSAYTNLSSDLICHIVYQHGHLIM